MIDYPTIDSIVEKLERFEPAPVPAPNRCDGIASSLDDPDVIIARRSGSIVAIGDRAWNVGNRPVARHLFKAAARLA